MHKIVFYFTAHTPFNLVNKVAIWIKIIINLVSWYLKRDAVYAAAVQIVD